MNADCSPGVPTIQRTINPYNPYFVVEVAQPGGWAFFYPALNS